MIVHSKPSPNISPPKPSPPSAESPPSPTRSTSSPVKSISPSTSAARPRLLAKGDQQIHHYIADIADKRNLQHECVITETQPPITLDKTYAIA